MFFEIRNLLPADVLICLYNARFLSFLQYGLIVWGQAYASCADPIYKLQKIAVRAISFQPHMSPSLPIFNEFKFLKTAEIYELRLNLTFIFDSFNKTLPGCFDDFSYSAHLLVSIPRDRPVKVIYICLRQIVFNMVLSLFDTLVPNFGMHYPWNSELLHRKYYSKQWLES